jgi:hypothetical protein
LHFYERKLGDIDGALCDFLRAMDVHTFRQARQGAVNEKREQVFVV